MIGTTFEVTETKTPPVFSEKGLHRIGLEVGGFYDFNLEFFGLTWQILEEHPKRHQLA